jgi:hypothetical protein
VVVVKPTDGDLIQLQSQAEFMAMGFGTREWKLLAAAIKELRGLRDLPEGTLIQRQRDEWVAMTPNGNTGRLVDECATERT